MTMTETSAVRGWCPGALTPMESGDGLIVRIRTRCGALSASDLVEIAHLAQRYGNGLIDLTRRANVQVRGVSAETIDDLRAELDRLGLLDGSPHSEAVRNVMVSPLAGIDPSEPCELRPVAWELERRLEADPALWRLPNKFGFIVDSGGSLSLDNDRADIRVKGCLIGGEPMAAIGIDADEGIHWIATVSPETAADTVVRIACAFLDLRGANARARMHDLPEKARFELRALFADFNDVPRADPAPQKNRAPLGSLTHENAVFAVGLAAPFGRIEADRLHAFAHSASSLGITDFRLSPWRAFYAAAPDREAAQRLLEQAQTHGFIIDAADPLLAIDACPGAPACASAALDTRATARCLAPLLGELRCRSVHVSGCAKGCARSKSADLVLVGNGDRFGVIQNGTTRDEPHLYLRPDDITRLPTILQQG